MLIRFIVQIHFVIYTNIFKSYKNVQNTNNCKGKNSVHYNPLIAI